MFPLRLPGVIFDDGDTQWTTEALPQNPRPNPTSTMGTLFARPYTQPARGNKLPFLVFELKSEAAGGTLVMARGKSGSREWNLLCL